MPIDWEAEEIILTLKNAGLPNLTDEQRERHCQEHEMRGIRNRVVEKWQEKL